MVISHFPPPSLSLLAFLLFFLFSLFLFFLLVSDLSNPVQSCPILEPYRL